MIKKGQREINMLQPRNLHTDFFGGLNLRYKKLVQDHYTAFFQNTLHAWSLSQIGPSRKKKYQPDKWYWTGTHST